MTGAGLQDGAPEVLAARYLAEACHELRTPVAVLSLVGSLGDHIERLDLEQLHHLADAVQRQTAHLRILIDRYLDHGMLQYGGGTVPDVEFDVSDVIASVIDSLHPLLGSERVHARLEAATIVGDPERVESIVTNLVLNAAKYSDETERIDVDLETVGGTVRLVVADRGIGIPVDHRERVLEPFHRAPNAVARAVAGVGLGLAIVVAHVEALGGWLQVDDRAGGGTVMTVVVPAVGPSQGSEGPGR
jgi:signal transduction histidine kinase